MKNLENWIEGRISQCDQLKDMEKEKWAFRQVLKQIKASDDVPKNELSKRELIKNPEVNIMFALRKDRSTAIYNDVEEVCDSLRNEIDEMHDIDLLEVNFNISTILLTDEEIENLPEFEGF